MARLPIPGSDSQKWGGILNEYLLESHKEDGSLKDGVVTNSKLANNSVSTAKVQNGAISEDKLTTSLRNKINTTGTGASGVSSVNTRTGDVTLTKADVGLSNVDNTSDANKPVSTAVQTALNSKAAANHTHTLDDLSDVEPAGAANGQSLVFNNGTWGPATVSGGSAIGDATTTAKGVVQLAGDLSGSATAPTVGNNRITTAKLADNAVNNAKLNAGTGTDGQVLTLDSSAPGGFKWTTSATVEGRIWNGTAAPSGATNGDLWIDTADDENVTLKALVGGVWISLATGAGSEGTPAITVPAAPADVSATAGNAQAVISFTTVTGATSYTVTSTPGNLTATGDNSPLTVNGLTNGTAYTFTVTATNQAGTSPASTASNSVTPSAPEPDTIMMRGDYAGKNIVVTGGTLSGKTITPTDGQQCRLTIEDEPLPIGTANTLTLNIDASPRDGMWVVDWFSSPTQWIGYAEIPTDGDYPLTSATAGTTHYKVSWKLNNTATINSMEVKLSTVADSQAPSAVTNLSATPSNTSVNLYWTAATDNIGVSTYELRTNNGSWQEIGTATSRTVTGLTAATTYTFSVRAKDAAGNTGTHASVETTTTSAPVTQPAPTGLVPGASGYGDNFAHIFKDTQFRAKARNAPAFNPSDKYAAGREVRNQMQSVAPDINFHAYNLPFFLVDTSKSPAEGGYTWQTMTKRYYQGQLPARVVIV